MTTIQWRPEVNALTTPQSYTVRYMPRNIIGYNELAADIALENPTWTDELVKSVLVAMSGKIKQHLINGNQVTLEDAFTFRLSFSARLNDLDDPLPPAEDMVKVKISASKPFAADVRQAAQLERLPMSEKLPLINSAEDTVMQLNDVLNHAGALRLTGSDLAFDQVQTGGECVLEGTRSGRAVQSRFVSISNTEITFMPDIPDQDDFWNNEYSLSVAARYTENGSLRTGIYRRKLRTPRSVDIGDNSGILTGAAAAPYVTATGGTLSADETVRIQAVFDLHEEELFVNLLDMTENGRQGEAVKVTANGAYVLPGFSGSNLTALNVTVNNYTDLVQLVRMGYSGRLVDILEMHVGE